MSRLPGPLRLVFKLLYQFVTLVWSLLFRARRPQAVLVQLPPALPTQVAVRLACRMRKIPRAALTFDWHNFAYTLMALTLGRGSPIVKVARWAEIKGGGGSGKKAPGGVADEGALATARAAGATVGAGTAASAATGAFDAVAAASRSPASSSAVPPSIAHLCVSKAMAERLREEFSIPDATVFYDRPPEGWGRWDGEGDLAEGVVERLIEGGVGLLKTFPDLEKATAGGADAPQGAAAEGAAGADAPQGAGAEGADASQVAASPASSPAADWLAELWAADPFLATDRLLERWRRPAAAGPRGAASAPFSAPPFRYALVVSSTSWTDDENTSMLLAAADAYDALAAARPAGSAPLPPILLVVTGKGENREAWERAAARRGRRARAADGASPAAGGDGGAEGAPGDDPLAAAASSDPSSCPVYVPPKGCSLVAPRTAWLSPGDYPRLLSIADLGTSLHASSSGVDLPMKIVDAFGCGLPVASLPYATLGELLVDGRSGLLFSTPEELAQHWARLFGGAWDARGGAPGPELERLYRGAEEAGRERWHDAWLRKVAPVLFRNAAAARPVGAEAQGPEAQGGASRPARVGRQVERRS